MTGASRGFGRAVVEGINKLQPTGIDFILTSRAGKVLSTLVEELKKESSCQTKCIVGTLDDEHLLRQLEIEMENMANCTEYTQVVLINNAGTLGDPSQLTRHFGPTNLAALNEYFAVNLSSFISLTGSFLSIFRELPSKIVVNVSSLVALQPLKGLSIYGVAKAARDAFIRSIALENSDVLCLNYAPGPMETDMAEILRGETVFVRDFYCEPKNLLQPKDSVEKLLHLLRTESFENASHVDVFDVDLST